MSWYVGEPSSVEYGKAISEANRRASDDYFRVCSNNCGFCGWYITTPYNKYILVESDRWTERYYTLHKYTRRAFNYGVAITDKKFKDINEAKEYIVDYLE